MNNRRTSLGVINGNPFPRQMAMPSRYSVGPGELKPASRLSMGAPIGGSMLARRPSMGGNVAAVAPQPRKSSLPRTSSLSTTNSRANDPRNISDKQFLSSSIRTLIEFLMQYGFDQQISQKILTKPANRDFHNIIVFLFKQIDPNYVLVGKLEDEIIGMFRFLGYPYPIAKSHISAVGSPHAWPNILATLMWLIELLRYDEAVRRAEENEDSTDNSNGLDEAATQEKKFYRYLARAYGYFIGGRDDHYNALEQQFISSYENRNLLVKDQLEALEARNAALASEIDEVKRRSAMIPELDQRRKDLQRELAALQRSVQDKEEELASIKQRTEVREREALEIKARTSSTNTEIAVLRDRISKQEISPEDVVHMVAERQRLASSCSAASEHRQSLQRRVIELETSLRDKVQALEDAVRAYHTIAEEMKMIPMTARNSRGVNFIIEIDVRTKKREAILKTAVKAEIMPALLDVRRELTEASLQIRGELMNEQEKQEELEAQRSHLQESLAHYEEKIRRAEVVLKREKDALEAANELQRREWDDLETRLIQLRDTAVEETRVTGASRRITELQALQRARCAEFESRRTATIEAIMEVASHCASHREIVQDGLSRVKMAFARRLESFLAESEESLGLGMMTVPRSAQRPQQSVVAPSTAPQPLRSHLDRITARRQSHAGTTTGHRQYQVQEEQEEEGVEEEREVSHTGIMLDFAHAGRDRMVMDEL